MARMLRRYKDRFVRSRSLRLLLLLLLLLWSRRLWLVGGRGMLSVLSLLSLLNRQSLLSTLCR